MILRLQSHHKPALRAVALAICSVCAAAAARLPIAFEPNREQAAGDFTARAAGGAVQLRANRVDLFTRGARVGVTLAGALQNARPQAEDKLPGVVHYLKGNDPTRWITDIPTYARVRYRAVYPGIDALYYGRDGHLEYDFVVAPGADPSRIRLRYDGGAPRIDPSGDLVIGALRQHRPVVYQTIDGHRREIAASWRLRGRTAEFALGPYDRARELIIDPAVTWTTYYGFSNAESGESVALDSAGNIYLAGTTYDASGYGDAYFAKLSPDGATEIFRGILSGSNDNEAHAIAVDAGGNIYLAGETNSTDFPANTTYTVYPGAAGDAFVSKIDPTGKQLVYSYFLGGSGQEVAFGIALDGSAGAYIVGATVSRDFPVSQGVAQTAAAGGVEAFVIHFDANGSPVYSTYLGGAGDDYGFAIAADSAGNVFVTGSTSSTAFPTTQSAVQARLGGGADAFVTKLSPAGKLVYSTYLGGSGDDFAYAIAIDSAGAAYITGETASADFPMANAAQAKFGGKSDAFIAKVSGSGAELSYSTYLGGSDSDAGNGIAVDAGGTAYLAGTTSSADLPLTNPFQAKLAGPTNALIAALDPSGAVQFASYLGGAGAGASNGDYGGAAALNCAAGLVVVGTSTSKDFPTTSGVFQPALNGPADAFVAKLGVGGTPAVAAGGVVSTASLTAGPQAPGSLISIPGSGLAGATVSLNGAPITPIAATGTRIDLQLPYETPTGSASVLVTNSCGSPAPVTFQVVPAAPYLKAPSADPVKVGGIVVIALTGIGPVDPATSAAKLPATATIGGWDAPIQFLGLMPGTVGWAQANLVVPGLSPGTYDVVITVGGVQSNAVPLTIQ